MTGCHFFPLESLEPQDVEGNLRIIGGGGDGEAMEYEALQRANTKYLEYLPLKLSIIDLLHKGKFWFAS